MKQKYLLATGFFFGWISAAAAATAVLAAPAMGGKEERPPSQSAALNMHQEIHSSKEGDKEAGLKKGSRRGVFSRFRSDADPEEEGLKQKSRLARLNGLLPKGGPEKDLSPEEQTHREASILAEESSVKLYSARALAETARRKLKAAEEDLKTAVHDHEQNTEALREMEARREKEEAALQTASQNLQTAEARALAFVEQNAQTNSEEREAAAPPPPGTPEPPETLKAPGTPATPWAPGTPETPGTPATPWAPGTPPSPEAPEAPKAPLTPRAPGRTAMTEEAGNFLAEAAQHAEDVLTAAEQERDFVKERLSQIYRELLRRLLAFKNSAAAKKQAETALQEAESDLETKIREETEAEEIMALARENRSEAFHLCMQHFDNKE